MTYSVTSKFGLPQWSAGTDGPTRQQFNTAFANLESRAIAFSQEAIRPAGGATGRMHRHPGTGRVTVDGGGFWAKFAAWFQNEPYDPASPTVSVVAIPGQTGTLQGWFNSAGNITARVDQDGSIVSNGNVISGNIGAGGLRYMDGNTLTSTQLNALPDGFWSGPGNIFNSYGTVFMSKLGMAAIQLGVTYNVGGAGLWLAGVRTFSAADPSTWGPWWRLA